MSENNKEEVEIDLLELAQKFWSNKKFIIKIAIVGAIIGVIVAFSIPKEYTTNVILTTESSKSAGGSMGVLASMTGINLGGSMGDDAFSPELYPDVLNSTPFVQGLLNINVSDPTQNINTTLYNYIKDEQKSAWWSYILKAPGALIELFKSTGTSSDLNAQNKYFISEEEMIVIGALKASYHINTNKKSGVTTLEVTAQSSKITAYLADTLTSYLQTYIIDYRTKKSDANLTNTKKSYKKTQDDYYTAQEKLANFVDRNQNISLESYRINQKKLENEASPTYLAYNQMVQQVQLAEIKVQDDIPVFTIIQPAIEPLFPEKPKKKLIVIAFVFLCVIGSSSWLLKQDLLKLLTNKE